MREELKRFYQELQEWIDADFPRHPVFSLDSGLCYQLEMWAEATFADEELGISLWNAQHQMFMEAGLDGSYPFDTKGSYNRAYMNDAMYRNPKRLAWIKEHAA